MKICKLTVYLYNHSATEDMSVYININSARLSPSYSPHSSLYIIIRLSLSRNIFPLGIEASEMYHISLMQLSDLSLVLEQNLINS